MIDSHYFSENYTGFILPVANTFHELALISTMPSTCLARGRSQLELSWFHFLDFIYWISTWILTYCKSSFISFEKLTAHSLGTTSYYLEDVEAYDNKPLLLFSFYFLFLYTCCCVLQLIIIWCLSYARHRGTPSTEPANWGGVALNCWKLHHIQWCD